jgi:hypothetical protein
MDAGGAAVTNVVDLRPGLRFVRPPAREEFHGMTFEQWVEQNADRIWQLLRAGDVRDRSFNDVAERLWSEL